MHGRPARSRRSWTLLAPATQLPTSCASFNVWQRRPWMWPPRQSRPAGSLGRGTMFGAGIRFRPARTAVTSSACQQAARSAFLVCRNSVGVPSDLLVLPRPRSALPSIIDVRDDRDPFVAVGSLRGPAAPGPRRHGRAGPEGAAAGTPWSWVVVEGSLAAEAQPQMSIRGRSNGRQGPPRRAGCADRCRDVGGERRTPPRLRRDGEAGSGMGGSRACAQFPSGAFSGIFMEVSHARWRTAANGRFVAMGIIRRSGADRFYLNRSGFPRPAVANAPGRVSEFYPSPLDRITIRVAPILSGEIPACLAPQAFSSMRKIPMPRSQRGLPPPPPPTPLKVWHKKGDSDRCRGPEHPPCSGAGRRMFRATGTKYGPAASAQWRCCTVPPILTARATLLPPAGAEFIEAEGRRPHDQSEGLSATDWQRPPRNPTSCLEHDGAPCGYLPSRPDHGRPAGPLLNEKPNRHRPPNINDFDDPTSVSSGGTLPAHSSRESTLALCQRQGLRRAVQLTILEHDGPRTRTGYEHDGPASKPQAESAAASIATNPSVAGGGPPHLRFGDTRGPPASPPRRIPPRRGKLKARMPARTKESGIWVEDPSPTTTNGRFAPSARTPRWAQGTLHRPFCPAWVADALDANWSRVP